MTLYSIFETRKLELEHSISNLKLPQDSKLVEKEVSIFLNNLIDEKGEFRLSLTQSEDYILQSSLLLLDAQRSMASVLMSEKSEIHEKSEQDRIISDFHGLKKEKFPQTVAATTIGGLVGKLALGSWGAVVGSIAGTAIMLYYVTLPKSQKSEIAKSPILLENVNDKIDTHRFLTIIGNICISIDTIISTFRTQIKRVVEKYESQPKPAIENTYGMLLEGIQSLVGYKRTHFVEEEKYVSKLEQKIEDLSELLENYNLELIDYSEEHSEWFDKSESANATESKMVYPAIAKNNHLVMKGKVFVPKK